jgi:competence protein ComEC
MNWPNRTGARDFTEVRGFGQDDRMGAFLNFDLRFEIDPLIVRGASHDSDRTLQGASVFDLTEAPGNTPNLRLQTTSKHHKWCDPRRGCGETLLTSCPTRNWAKIAGMLVAAVFCVASIAEAAVAPLGKFTLTCLDIPDIQRGAGLAIVLQLPGGGTWLYDTGNGYPSKTNASGWASDHNTGRDVIAPFLKQHNIRELDGVLISHAHYDHFGGLIWLADNFPVKKLYDSGYEFSGQSSADYTGEIGHYSKLRADFKKRAGVYKEAHTGDKLFLDKQLDVEVTAPPKEFFTEPHPERRPKTDPPAHYLVNANSLGIRIRHGNVVFLLPGDIQGEDQRQSLLPATPPGKLKCNILIAPGHGIHSIPEFAEASRPEVTIASVFPRYAKGSPAPKVFGKVGSKVYLTGVHGWVQVVSDGEHYTVKAERGETEGAK